MSLPIFSNYTVISELGQGGMATVYLAKHNILGHQVAIKVLDKQFAYNENIKARFVEEAKKLVRLDHPNVVKVTDFISENEIVAIVMEYIQGESFRELLNAKRLNDTEIENYLNQMVAALNYIHKEGIVHRDIKPSNFIIATNGILKLVDFGISKSIDASSVDFTSTSTNLSMGTLLYMSPEQIKSTKEVTYLSDIYSLGVVLWEMVMGKVPYNSNELSAFEIQVKIVQEKLPNTNTKWDKYIQVATIKDENQRVWVLDLLKNKKSNITNTVKNEKTTIIKNIINNEHRNLLFEKTKKSKKQLLSLFLFFSVISSILLYKNFILFFEDYREANNQLRIFKRGEKFGLANNNSRILLKPKYDNITNIKNQSFLSSNYVVCDLGNKKGLINELGKIVLPIKYDAIFMTEFNYIQTKNNNKYGLYDQKLKKIFSEKNNKIIHNSFFKEHEDKFGGIIYNIIIAKTNEQVEILNLNNSERYYFEDIKENSISKYSPYLFVKRNNKWGIINYEHFTMVQPFKFDEILRDSPISNDKESNSNICLGYYKADSSNKCNLSIVINSL
jgi:serine/threonine protein kinase